MRGEEGHHPGESHLWPFLRHRSSKRRVGVEHDRSTRGSVLGRRLSALIRQHQALALPGHGETLARFRILADIAEEDLSLGKLFESHADALAILSELNERIRFAPDLRWTVWCAELPSHRLRFTPLSEGRVRIDGSKAFASGFAFLTHALVSGFGPEGERLLAAVELSDPGLSPISGGFYAAGMSATETVDLEFDGVEGTLIGPPSAYLERPGFLYGAAGVAACWFGGARAILKIVHSLLERRRGAPQLAKPDTKDGSKNKTEGAKERPRLHHEHAQLGSLDIELSAAASALREAAEAIDACASPQDAAPLPKLEIMRARLSTERACESIITRAPRMTGAGPLCRDIALDRTLNDLRIYIRQSHAERDLEAHGETLSALEGGSLWRL